jgi:hypothetical protein
MLDDDEMLDELGENEIGRNTWGAICAIRRNVF